MNITKITKNTNTIYEVNKKDSLITFEGHNYNINDNATARNLIYMLMDKIMDNDILIDDYKTLLKKETEAYNSKNEQFKRSLKKLEDKLDYYQKLDQKSFLQILKLENKINDYEINYISYDKYEELQNDYINVVQILNNKNRGVK